MTIRLYNTATKKKEDFVPIKNGEVSMYHCGPTVYNFAHIGNISAFIFADTLRRTMEYNGYTVKQAINITDFGHLTDDSDSGDDKMLNGLKREGLPFTMEGLQTLAKKYTDSFVSDLETLNIKSPTWMPRATEHIKEYIDLISKLEQKGIAYKSKTAIYFDTEKIDDYGKLGNLPTDLQSRIGENTDKRNPRDFALWKFNDKFGWESPWGKGFPGWHIECSAMSMKYLGTTLDIHTGGIEHIPVHHNNEIAQSEHSTDLPFAHIWMHRAHVKISGEKISKSIGNTIYVKDFFEMGIHPSAFRYWTLLSHYKTDSDFSKQGVLSAQNALENIVSELIGTDTGNIIESVKEKFLSAINDDLNTPQAIAVIWDLLKSNESKQDIKATILDFDNVLGLRLNELITKNEQSLSNISEHIKGLLQRRKDARERKDFAESDQIRDLLKEHGFSVKDTIDDQKILPISLLF